MTVIGIVVMCVRMRVSAGFVVRTGMFLVAGLFVTVLVMFVTATRIAVHGHGFAERIQRRIEGEVEKSIAEQRSRELP